MNLRFWQKAKPEIPNEPEKRGYFDMVAAADVNVSMIGENIPRVNGPEQAMRLATVYRCVSILSGSIAALPLQLKRKKNGYFIVDEDDPINYALTQSPNRRQTAFELMRNAVIQMVNAGNAYIYPEWMGEELRLILLSPGSVSYDKLLNIYLVNDPINNIFETLGPEEIIHLRNMSLDGGYTGVSTIRYACEVMSVAASADAKSLNVLQPGSGHRGFISGNSNSTRGIPNLQDEQYDPTVKRINEYLKSDKGITYLPGDMKFYPLSLSPADIQLMELKKLGVLDICRFYGVHPDKSFAGQSQNYKASEMSQVQFMTDTLQPILRQIENEFYVKLIPRSLAGKYRIEFNLESFYQTDLDTMSKFMEKEIQWAASTPNEWRKRRGREPLPGGDTAFISCNVAPIDSPKIKGETNKYKNKSSNGQNLPPKNGDTSVG